MNLQQVIFLLILAMGLASCLLLVLFLTSYVKVGPNEVLIVSGRRRQLPDGRIVGCRLVTGGGTVVFPILEKAQRLSLEVLSIELPKFKTRIAEGASVEADCFAQVKINGGDSSILAAAEHFLGKSEADMKSLVRTIFEKHLRAILGNSNVEEVNQDPGACAERVHAAASEDLGRMGLRAIGFTIQNVLVK